MANPVIDVDGDRATARSYVDAWITSKDGLSGINAIGFYDDELVRTFDGWRIARRTFTQVRVAVASA
jgi:SnoaL-like protein